MESIGFSILITAYNSEKFIEQSIKSALRQSYENSEIIIVEDGSTDHTISVIKRFEKNRKVKIYYNDKNRGYGYALRKAFSHATKQYAVILDSDDMLMKKALKIMSIYIKKNRDYALYHSKRLTINEKGIIDRRRQIKQEFYNLGNSKYIDHLRRREKSGISHLKVVNMKFYNKTDGVSPLLGKKIDKDLIAKLEEVGKFYFVDEFLYLYRRWEGTMSSRFKKIVGKTKVVELGRKINDIIIVNAELRRILKNENLS